MSRRRRSTGVAGDESIRLVVVEPRAILGVAVREILDREADFEIIAYVTTAAEAIAVVDDAAPDVVLVDGPLPTAEATEATRQLRKGAPDSAFVVMGRDDDDASIVEAAEVGATAHVPAMARPAELVATIRRVAGGEYPLKDELKMRPDLIGRIVDDIRDSVHADRGRRPFITPRELDILAHVARGRRNRDIAEDLGVTEQTVKNHLSAIFHRLGVPNRTHAVTYATRQGWLDIGDIPTTRGVHAGRN